MWACLLFYKKGSSQQTSMPNSALHTGCDARIWKQLITSNVFSFGAFEKLPKAILSFVMAACQSVRKSVKKVHVWLKSEKNTGYCALGRAYIYCNTMYLAEFFIEWEMFQTEVVAKLKHAFYAQHNFPENRAVFEIMRNKTVQPDSTQTTIL